MRVPLAASGLRESDIQAVINTLKSGNLTMGEQVRAFESQMATYLKKKHFIMLNSGSSANLAIFESLLRPSKGNAKLKRGDGVLVPAIAWPTTVWPVVQLGLRPEFVDVEINNAGMDLKHAQFLLEKSKLPIKCIFPIHPLGFALDNQELKEFSEKNNLLVVNDVCESLGSWRKGEHAGSFGLASSYSFYFSHHITTMEGGGVATDCLDLADDLRSIRSHGWSRDRSDASKWHSNSTSTDAKFLFVTAGFNIRPMEIQASIGRLQLRDLETFISKRRSIAHKVMTSLEGTLFSVLDGGCLSGAEDESAHSWMLLGIRILGNNAEKMRKPSIEKLNKLGIETRPVLTGNFLEQPAIARIHENLPHPSEFPNASKLSRTSFLVSAHHDLTNEQVEYLASSLRSVALEVKRNADTEH